jgi:ribosomal protein S19
LLNFKQLSLENASTKSLFLKKHSDEKANLGKSNISSSLKKTSTNSSISSASAAAPASSGAGAPPVQSSAPLKIYIWSRNSTILPIFTNKNHLIYVYDGKKFAQVRIVPEMIGHKFGEFCLTRKSQIKVKGGAGAGAGAGARTKK